MTNASAPWADVCVGCDRRVAQRDDLGLCPDCAAKLDRDMIRARDWERSWTAWQTPADQREALRDAVVARAGAGYELMVPPAPPGKRSRRTPDAKR